MEENKKKVLEIMDDEWLSFYEKADAILALFDVRQQRELLIAYEKTVGAMDINEVEKEVDKYLKDKGN